VGGQGRVTICTCTILLLNTTTVLQTQTNFKTPTCCAFVHITSEFSFVSGAVFSNSASGTDTKDVESCVCV
jgi:hypothetical protein